MPAAGLVPLRVGPEDVGGNEAGDLISKLGIHNQAKALMQANARQMPIALRTAMQRTEYTERSKHLDEEEVLQQTLHTVDPDKTGSIVYKILSARVRSSRNNVFDGAVVVLYETMASRTARCAILYNENTFPASVRAYNEALREGKVELPGELGDRADLRESLDKTRQEVQRLATENAELRGETPETAPDAPPPLQEVGEGDELPPADNPDAPAEVTLPDGVYAGDPGWPTDEEGNLIDLPQSVRDELIAAHERDEAAAAQAAQTEAEIERLRAEAEAQPPATEAEPELTVENLPEGVEPGDPGYPVNPETGELVQMPQAARDALIAQAESEAPAEEPPIDLDTVELPEGNADQIKASVSFYSSAVLAALVKRDTRSSVRDAAATELQTRPDAARFAEPL